MSEKVFEDKFNKVVQWLINFIGKIAPGSFIGEHHKILNEFILKKPEEPIVYFIQYVYKNDEYRNKLLNMDDTYFLNQSIDDFIGDHTINPIVYTYIQKLFYYKELWGSFDNNSKTMIKKAMKGLIIICTNYIDALYEAKFGKQEVKNKTRNKLPKVDKKDSTSKYDTDSISVSSSSVDEKKHGKYINKKTLKSISKKTRKIPENNKYDASSISIESSQDKNSSITIG